MIMDESGNPVQDPSINPQFGWERMAQAEYSKAVSDLQTHTKSNNVLSMDGILALHETVKSQPGLSTSGSIGLAPLALDSWEQSSPQPRELGNF